ncbi:MAG TPA: hypothetical protein VF263_10190 [Longimicrobiaceae bacterium]
MGRMEVLLWIAGSGAFGGFVDGLLFSREYKFRVGKIRRDLGSVGDALVGATAGVAIFVVADAIFKIQVENLQRTAEFVRLVAWGVLSGFAGLRVLQPLSEKFITDVAGKTARDVVRTAAVQNHEAAVHVQSGEALLTKFDFAKSEGMLEARKAQFAGSLEVAENKFKAALAMDPGNLDALRGQAKVYRRRADLAAMEHRTGEQRRLMNLAVDTVSQIIEHNPDYALAYYSRACYRSLMKDGPDVVLADLQEAIRLNPAIGELAKTDPDFTDAIRKDAAFAELTGTAGPEHPSTATRKNGRRRGGRRVRAAHR